MMATLADIADLTAALGVMVSVAVLAWELHQTRKQAELNNWRDLLQTLVDYKHRHTDLEFAAFLVRAHADFDALSEGEKLSFGMFLEEGIHIYGNFLKHNDSLPRKLEGLDDAVGNYFVDMLTTSGGAAWLAQTRKLGRFMPGTYRTIDEILARGRVVTDRG